MRKLNWVPNTISISRILLVVPIVIVAKTSLERAFFLYAFGCFTDLLDGFAARKLHATTKIGTYLDPLADRIFVLATLILLTSRGDSPVWFLALTFSATLLQTVGLLALKGPHFTKNKFSPLRIGKWNTFVLFFWTGFIFFDASLSSFELWPSLRLVGFALSSAVQILALFRYCFRSRHFFSRILMETSRRLALEAA